MGKIRRGLGDYNQIHLVRAAARQALNARFSGVVLLNDKISVGGCVIRVEGTDGGHLYEFEVRANRGEDAVVPRTVGFLVYGR